MSDKPSRNHYVYIIKNIIGFIKNLWWLVLIIITKGFEFSAILSALVFLGVGTIFIVLDWSKTKFYIKDDLLILEKGIISRSKEDIPFDKINTIDFGQSILDRIFGVCTLKIDTGSVVSEKSEFKIIAKYEFAEEIKKTILKTNTCKLKENEDGVDDLNNAHNLDKKFSSNVNFDDDLISEKVITKEEIFKYALTKGKLFWAIGGFFALFNFADDIEKLINIKFSKIIERYVNLDILASKSIVTIALSAIVFTVFIYMLILIGSIIFEMIRLNDFTVKLYKNKISISYGLFTKKQYSFQIDKIYGIKYKQSMLQQLMNIATIELIAIGYGDEKNEKAILYPIVDNKFRNELMKKILPNMIFEGDIIKPPRSSLRRFILKGTLIWSVILTLAYIFLNVVPNNVKLAISTIIIALSIVGGLLNYKNTYLGINKKVLIACSGSFDKVTTIIREDIIQSITKKQSIFQRWGRVCTYQIDLYSNQLGDIIEVKHMQELDNDYWDIS
ncbi:PH domain-containing protein [Clostridium sp. MB40-C1]|uniref:PH domain-containing protein n=1 Tax=Clostridium sp. MB40-C1 TaxID=3070996 RepID=UPI0027DF92BA|nr:PH domain-containing protein [Clostridium sp. MB40-C1]WMJ79350.1 PH domain-containing protein [Clostridium sp. MB40-C1]